MAQHDYDIANQSGAAFRADLNNALQAIVSNNSGPAAPSTTYAYQLWIDSSTTPATIKRRDGSNASWVTLGLVDGSINLPTVNTTPPANGVYLPAANNVALATNSTQRLLLDATGQIEAVSLGSATAPTFSWTTDTNTGLYSPGADQVAITTGGTQRATVDSSGRLLVGTSSSISNSLEGGVQVAGTAADAYLTLTRFSSVASAPAGIIIGRSKSATKGTNTIVASGDYLGSVFFTGADGTSYIGAADISAYVDGTPGANDMPGRLVFSVTRDNQASPLEAMRISRDGLVSVGTTNVPTGVHSFYWQGPHRFTLYNTDTTAANNYGINISYINAAPNGTGNEFIICVDSVAQRFTARSNGGLANYQANNVNLSDRNAKKDISPAAGTWDCLKEWEIVNYRYKDQPDDADLNLGVIAQQVAESCPEVITVFEEAKDDQPEKLGIKEQQMYWMAIKALQEAQVRIETLEAEVAALKAQ